MVKSLRLAMELLDIRPFDTTGLDEVSRLSPGLLSPFALSVKRSAHQHKIYQLISQTNVPGRAAHTHQPELKSFVALVSNPNLKRSTLYLMIRDGLWKDFPNLLWQPLFDLKSFANASPEIRGNISPELANMFFQQNHNICDSLILELWSVGVQHKNSLLKINCATHPNASVDMIDAYLSGSTVQEIELMRQGIDKDHLESIKDFFWY